MDDKLTASSHLMKALQQSLVFWGERLSGVAAAIRAVCAQRGANPAAGARMLGSAGKCKVTPDPHQKLFLHPASNVGEG